MTKTTPTDLQRHMMGTYFALRWGLIVLAIALPIVLPLVGLLDGIPYQHSLSAYYHALGANEFSLRDAFVGLLFAVGASLFLYKGYSPLENTLLNVAGVLIAGVALFPMAWPEPLPDPSSLAAAATSTVSLHGFLAVAFFLCIAAVCIFCSKKTLKEIPDVQKRLRFKRIYEMLGAVMVAAPLGAYASSVLLAGSHTIILVESAGVLAFAAYWFAKTRELAESNVEEKALRGHVDFPLAPASLGPLDGPSREPVLAPEQQGA